MLKLEPAALRLVTGTDGIVAEGAGRHISFEAGGVRLQAAPQGLRLARARLPMLEPGDDVPPQLRGDSELVYVHPHHEEHWTVRGHKLEQSWWFAERPVLDGNLTVRVPVTGGSFEGSSEQGLRFKDAESGAVTLYSHGTFRDARGVETPVPARFDGGEIKLELPAALLAQSSFPAVLDPTITPMGVWNLAGLPSVAYNPDTAEYMVAFLYEANVSSKWFHVYGGRVANDGGLIDATPQPLVTTNSTKRLLELKPPATSHGQWRLVYQNLYQTLGNLQYWDLRSLNDERLSSDYNPFTFGPALVTTDVVSTSSGTGYVLKLGSQTLTSPLKDDPVIAATDTLIAWLDRSEWQKPILSVRGPNGTIRTSLQSQGSFCSSGISMASGGGVHLLAWSNNDKLLAVRLGNDGSFLDDPANPIVVRATNGCYSSRLVFDGENFSVIWEDPVAFNVLGRRITVTGELVDEDTYSLLFSTTYGFDVASDGAGHILIASKFAHQIASGIDVRLVDLKAVSTGSPNGASCNSFFWCQSGHCVDHVCCDSACGNSKPGDCQACSAALGASQDGVCSVRAQGSSCRTATGVCDVAESCDGASPACPPDAVMASSTQCGPVAAGPCDLDDRCDGTSKACRSDLRQPASTVCRQARDVCDAAELCDGTATVCPADGWRSIAAVCRAAVGACDTAESCSGTSDACPPDRLLGAGSVCRAKAEACDAMEACDGLSAICPSDLAVASGTVCRKAEGECDADELCDGSSLSCPTDRFEVGAECRAALGACDVAEVCEGNGPRCPTDGFAPLGDVCRPAAGSCDTAESCTGGSASCPFDLRLASGTVCRSAAGACDAEERCAGAVDCPEDNPLPKGTLCRLPVAACDPAETCNGVERSCPEDLSCEAPSSGEAPEFPEVIAPAPRTNDGGGCDLGNGPRELSWSTWLVGLIALAMAGRRTATRGAWLSRSLLWPVAIVALVACGTEGTSNANRSPLGAQCSQDVQCWQGLYCDDQERVCAEYGTADHLCWMDACKGELRCGEDERCVAKLTLNEACGDAQECGRGLLCLEQRCATVEAYRTPCGARGTCAAGMACVLDVCRMPGAMGEPCLPGLTCASALSCIDGSCQAIGRANGQPCYADNTCDEALGFGCSEDGLCSMRGRVNQLCFQDHTCNTGLFCSQNRCTAALGLAVACNRDQECASNACGVSLEHKLAGAPKTCIRVDGYCAITDWSFDFGNDLCGGAACRRECASCQKRLWYDEKLYPWNRGECSRAP